MDVPALAERVRAAVEDTGLLLIHDNELPSATAIAAGGPFGGSWWAHALAHPIYDALQLIEDDVVRAKVVRGKVTLVAPRLWPALAAVGASRSPWQLDALTADATDLLAQVDGADVPMRTPSGATKAAGLLEQRLLVHAENVHTESGRHTKVLQPWDLWIEERHLSIEGMAIDDAIADLERAVSSWPPIRGRLFPWR